MTQLIKDYTNYEIDENGKVTNLITKNQLKGSISEQGYLYYRLSKDNSKKMFYAHRLVAEAFLPNPNNLPVVNHIDGNKLNNNVNNLEWVSYSENVLHAHQTNLIKPVREREYYMGDYDGEVWKVINNFPYSVSNLGRVRNDRSQLILKPSTVCGYYKVRLSVNGVVTDAIVHKLVYCTFNQIPDIPKGYVIDHINANKLDNRLENLRLVTNSENVQAAFYETKTNKACKEVKQFDLDGNYIATYPSTKEASRRLNLDSSSISKVCRGVQKTCGGYIFKYSE